MIEAAAARELVERLCHVEDRLGRLLTSGWRQSSAEAADLRLDADALAEAGLTALAGRIAAVAEAADAGQALAAIALATNACRLLRVRLLAEDVPEGWAPLRPPTSKSKAAADTLLPVARLLLEGREVWACVRPPRSQWLLLEPPFPVEEPPAADPVTTAPSGIFGRLRRQIDRVRSGEQAGPAPWMHRPVKGRLHWLARYPLGADGDVNLCALDGPEWDPEPNTERLGIQAFHQTLADRILVSGAPVFPMGGGFRLMELERDDPAAFVWLHPSAAEAFGRAPTPKVWTIAWTEGKALVPVAIVTRGERGASPRLTHLIPGSPEDVLVATV